MVDRNSQFIARFGDPEKQVTNLTCLGNHITLINGYAFKSDGFCDAGIPVIKIANVNKADFSTGSMQFHVLDETLDRFVIRPGDVLISLTGTAGKDDFGHVCIVDGDYDCYYLNQRNAKLGLHDDLIPEFVVHLLKNKTIRTNLIKSGTGVRQCHLHNHDLESIKFVLPNLEDQKRFAAFVQQSDKSKFAALNISNLNLSLSLKGSEKVPREWATLHHILMAPRLSQVIGQLAESL